MLIIIAIKGWGPDLEIWESENNSISLNKLDFKFIACGFTTRQPGFTIDNTALPTPMLNVIALADPATITPAEWESLKNDETATEVGPVNPASSLLSLCMTLAVYDETGSTDDLQGLLTASQIARGSSKPCTLLDEKKGGYWECIRQLGQGEMEQQDAQRLLEAYKELWPQAMNFLADRILAADAIIQLDKGLSRVPYDDLILKSLDNTIESLHLGCPTNEQDTLISSATLIADPAETSDVHVASELVKLKIQADAMKMIAPLRSWRDYISKDKDITLLS
ncbi:hypothetical protein FAGAP_817 [Fusarium agapanthi]|uniref:Uncharacterized protein n=1 Tax=Fusarium agapanthi TaxID=1803897 RepID=A0A9P5BQB7_9HYPO|nr:hypothetical protein FAGAP_817 [Fusarium agapanthi]